MTDPALFDCIALAVSILGTAVTVWIGYAAFSVSRQSHRLAAKSRKDDDTRDARAERRELAESFLAWLDMRGNTVPMGRVRRRPDPAVEEFEKIIRNRASLTGHTVFAYLFDVARQMREDEASRTDPYSRSLRIAINDLILKSQVQAWVADPTVADDLRERIAAMRSGELPE